MKLSIPTLGMGAKLGLAAGGVLLVIGLFYAGVQHLIGIGQAAASAEHQQQIVKIQQHIAELKERQDRVTTRLDQLTRAQAAKTRQQGSQIKEKVVSHVPSTTPALPPGFRVLHDAATDGSPVPDAAGVSHGARVPAQEAAATVIDNYTGCRENAIKVEGFQRWVREQRALSEQSRQDLDSLLGR